MLRWLGFAVVAVMFGCSASTGGGQSTSQRPDTGYGANQDVPATVNCAAACARLDDCTAHLCSEDGAVTTQADGGLAAACLTRCEDGYLQGTTTADQWTCTFRSSCRQVYDYDVCGLGANYGCN